MSVLDNVMVGAERRHNKVRPGALARLALKIEQEVRRCIGHRRR